MPVSWLKRDALLFANSIGCKADELHFLYVRLKAALYLRARIGKGADKLTGAAP